LILPALFIITLFGNPGIMSTSSVDKERGVDEKIWSNHVGVPDIVEGIVEAAHECTPGLSSLAP
jgi:hypothetical protein